MSKVLSKSTTAKKTSSALKSISSSSANNMNKRNYEDLSKEELIEAIEQRDVENQKLVSENKRLKATTKTNTTSAVVDPEKAQQAGLKLRSLAVRGIKSQMKWKPSCKYSKARFSWSSLCANEATFRAFRGLDVTEKKKGTGKMSIEDFETLMDTSITTSIRYGYLRLKGDNVNITYSKESGEVKVTGGYGL